MAIEGEKERGIERERKRKKERQTNRDTVLAPISDYCNNSLSQNVRSTIKPE